MLALLFGFRGEASRVAYVAVNLGTWAAMSLYAALVSGWLKSLSGSPDPGALPGLLLAAGVTLVLAGACVWSWVAISVKRLRDMGWPRPGIGLAAVLALACAEVAAVRAATDFSWPSLVSVSFIILLAVSPSQGGDRERSRRTRQTGASTATSRRVPGQFGLRSA